MANTLEPGLLGAIVGDAATMPVHWIYDETKLRGALDDASKPEFNSKLSCPFYSPAEFPGHYGHGQVSPYGEQFLSLLGSTRSNKGDIDKIAQNFYDWAASYTGRKDGALKEFCEHYSQGKRNPDSGADDSQAQCLYKAVIAVGTGHADNVRSLINFHQNNQVAIGCGQVYADFLLSMKTEKMTARGALDKIIEEKGSLPEFLKPHIDFLLNHIGSSDTGAMLKAWADEFGKSPLSAIACACPPALLRSLHICVHATSYEQGLRNNMLIGGDNCSTALSIGAALGYQYGAPESWTKQVSSEVVGSL